MNEFTVEDLINEITKTVKKIEDIKMIGPVSRLMAYRKRVDGLTALLYSQFFTLKADVEKWQKTVKRSNDLLRSAYLIAHRKGAATNWDAFKKRLEKELQRQQEEL